MMWMICSFEAVLDISVWSQMSPSMEFWGNCLIKFIHSGCAFGLAVRHCLGPARPKSECLDLIPGSASELPASAASGRQWGWLLVRCCQPTGVLDCVSGLCFAPSHLAQGHSGHLGSTPVFKGMRVLSLLLCASQMIIKIILAFQLLL